MARADSLLEGTEAGPEIWTGTETGPEFLIGADTGVVAASDFLVLPSNLFHCPVRVFISSSCSHCIRLVSHSLSRSVCSFSCERRNAVRFAACR